MKVSKDFWLHEFICPTIYKQFGDRSIWFIDHNLITIAQWFRDYTGKASTINGIFEGVEYVNSGLREFDCKEGASKSQHKFGRAEDLKVEGFTGEELREIVMMNEAELLSLGLTTIEDGTETWLHGDTRYTGMNKIFVVPFK